MALPLFTLDGTDYTNNIINGTYDVSQNDVYEEWTDANHVIHQHTMRTRYEGQFTMRFRTLASYEAFVADMAAHKTAGNKYTVTVWANNTLTSKEVEAFMEWHPVPTQKENLVFDYGEFSVSLKEA